MNAAIFSKDNPNLDPSAEDDFYLDDGLMVGVVTIVDRELTLHDVEAKDKTKHGARSGVGRQSMQGLRSQFSRIVASGVMHPLADMEPAPRDVASMMFWVAMLREGLIDSMCLMNDGTDIDRPMLEGPIETGFGTIRFGAGGTYVFESARERRYG